MTHLSQTFTVWCRRHSASLALPSRPMQRGLRIAWSLCLFGLACALLVRLSSLADLKRAWAQTWGIGAPLALLLALPAVSHFVKMLGWRSLLPPGARPKLLHAYAAFVAAQGVNELGFSVLGEPLKIWVLPSEDKAAGLRAVLADNLAALAALFAVMATLTRLREAVLPCLALVLLALWRARRSRAPSLLVAFFAHYLGKLWLVVELGLALYFLGQPVLRTAPTLALSWLGAAAVGAPVPGQLGVVEAALLQTGRSLGIATSSLLALALVRRLRSLVWIVVGVLLAARIVKQKQKGGSPCIDCHCSNLRLFSLRAPRHSLARQSSCSADARGTTRPTAPRWPRACWPVVCSPSTDR